VVICVLLVIAALIWPLRLRVDGRGSAGGAPSFPGSELSAPPDSRLAMETAPTSPSRSGSGWLRILAVPMALATIATAGLLAGVAGVLAAGAALATGALLVRQALTERRRRMALTDIAAGLRMLGRELRAGAEPALAAANAGSAARGEGAEVLAGVAHLARFDSALAVRVEDDAHDPRSQTLIRLRSGWLLTRRHGLAFTPLVDALAVDLSGQLTADAERAGQVAGPRMSGYVMAVLPLMGLALGVGMGADPMRVLLNTAVGNVLLVVGVLLTCAGLLWSARIVRR